MNNQPAEQRLKIYTPLDIQEIFQTLQGEGPFSGTPCTFVRLAGCNLQCPGCDTDYTSKRHELSVCEIINQVKEFGQKLIVITGGEPFRQPHVQQLICELLDEGFYVQVETNGTLPLPMKLAGLSNKQTYLRTGLYIVVSPKTGSLHPTITEVAAAYKYVIDANSIDPDDGLPILALNHTAKPRVARPIWLKPADALQKMQRPSVISRIYIQAMDVPSDNSGNSTLKNIQACINSSLKFGYTFQLQIHKLIGLP